MSSSVDDNRKVRGNRRLVLWAMIFAAVLVTAIVPYQLISAAKDKDKGEEPSDESTGHAAPVITGAPTAPLTTVFALPSANIRSQTVDYTIGFTTSTVGTIKTIEMAFPAGFGIAGARLIEKSDNLGAGSLTIAGQTLIYTVTTAASIPLGTPITIHVAGITNHVTASSGSVAVTTKVPAGGIIDGPTASTAFSLIQSSSSMLGAASVTGPKIASSAVTGAKVLDGSLSSFDINDNSIGSVDITDDTIVNLDIADGGISGEDVGFMKRVTLLDGTNGWNPDGVATSFVITEAECCDDNDIVVFGINGVGAAVCSNADSWNGNFGTFTVVCSSAPANNSELHYMLITVPSSFVGSPSAAPRQ